jgi:hypothetical protein
LYFVVGAPVLVLALAIAVVAATIFEAMAHDIRGDRGRATCSIIVAQSGVCVTLGIVLLMLICAGAFRQAKHALLAILVILEYVPIGVYCWF